MEIKDEFDFRDLMNKCWSGAKDTLEMIEDKGYEDELMSHLEDEFYGDIPTLTEVNDYLWFEEDAIKEALGIFELDEKIDVSDVKKANDNLADWRKPRMITNGDLIAYDDLEDGSMSESDLSEQIDEITTKIGEVNDKVDELLDVDNEDDFDTTKDELYDLVNELDNLVIDYVKDNTKVYKEIEDICETFENL